MNGNKLDGFDLFKAIGENRSVFAASMEKVDKAAQSLVRASKPQLMLAPSALIRGLGGPRRVRSERWRGRRDAWTFARSQVQLSWRVPSMR